MKKLNLLLVGFMSIIVANATASERSIYFNRGFINDAISGSLSDEDLKGYIDKQGHEKLFQSIHSYADGSSEPKEIKELDSTMIRILEDKYPNMKGNWTQEKPYGGVTIAQNDNLYDLERVKFSNPEFSSGNFGVTEQKIGNAPIFDKEIPQTSYHRMMNGLPAVGTDGEDVRICRIIRSEHAKYYEFSHVEFLNAIKIVGEDMTIDQACLTNGKYISEYWKLRKDDFKIVNRL